MEVVLSQIEGTTLEVGLLDAGRPPKLKAVGVQPSCL
jgi:hypothetical protein